jgi:hypothetical protein
MKNQSTVRMRSALQQSTQRLKTVNPKKAIGAGVLALSLALSAIALTSAISPSSLKASDHDDGDIDVRSRALSLTDLYVFREGDLNPNAKTDDLILVMNTNPRSLARQQYYFSDKATYDFNITRVADKDSVPTGKPDVTLRFTFSPPDRNFQQQITLTTLFDGGRGGSQSFRGEGGRLVTTPIFNASNPTVSQVSVNGSNLSVFAGLREDPFFFDVEQYFRVRAGAAGFGPPMGFRPANQALDFTKGYNVNTIVVRVPRKFLQASTNATTFDVWLSLRIPDPKTGKFVQTEQLARPGINELLTTGVNQEIYAAYNRTQPTRSTEGDAGVVRNNIKQTLKAVGNDETRANLLLNALLPDVMRIDTTIRSGYGAALNKLSAPIGGRMLLDDVVDISLVLVTNNAIRTDNVSYTGTPNNPAQGHQPLVNSFPYLALPN